MGETLQPVKNAARRLGISVWTIRKRAYEGDVASVKIGAKCCLSPNPKLSDKFKKRCAQGGSPVQFAESTQKNDRGFKTRSSHRRAILTRSSRWSRPQRC
jgi:hypothetical protein